MKHWSQTFLRLFLLSVRAVYASATFRENAIAETEESLFVCVHAHMYMYVNTLQKASNFVEKRQPLFWDQNSSLDCPGPIKFMIISSICYLYTMHLLCPDCLALDPSSGIKLCISVSVRSCLLAWISISDLS